MGLKTHQTVKHGDGEYVRDEVHINGMESFWAFGEGGYNGTFRHIEPKQLHHYINEFAGWLNMKMLCTVDKMCAIIQNLVGKCLAWCILWLPARYVAGRNGRFVPRPDGIMSEPATTA